MQSLEFFQRLQMYEDRANDAVLVALEGHGDAAPPRALALLGHLLAARRNWLSRLTGSGEAAELFPTPTLGECRQWHEALRTATHRHLGSLTEEALGNRISFRLGNGQHQSNTVADILTHVALHSAHHRGQVALVMREAGLEPPRTDFILFTWGGLS